MTIQIINCSKEDIHGNTTYSRISAPRSIDEFELNIIDLSDNDLWYSSTVSVNGPVLLSQNDLLSLNTMIRSSHKATILFVLPQDISLPKIISTTVFPNKRSENQYEEIRIKDILPTLKRSVFSVFAPIDVAFDLSYENTTTLIEGIPYSAAFYFTNYAHGISMSNGSMKTTTVRFNERIFLTTLDVLSSDEHLGAFISSRLSREKRSRYLIGCHV